MSDQRPTLMLPATSGCRRGHASRPAPDVHPDLGMVPARTSTWFGAAVLVLVVALLWWLLPDAALPWVVAVLGSWYVLTGLVQLALGHRGGCLVRRTGRWFFGPVGALLDPFESG